MRCESFRSMMRRETQLRDFQHGAASKCTVVSDSPKRRPLVFCRNPGGRFRPPWRVASPTVEWHGVRERARARARSGPLPRAPRVASFVARSRGSDPLLGGVPRSRLSSADSDDPERSLRALRGRVVRGGSRVRRRGRAPRHGPTVPRVQPRRGGARVARVALAGARVAVAWVSRSPTAARSSATPSPPSAPCTSNSAKPSRRARISSAPRLPPRSDPSRTACHPSTPTPRSTFSAPNSASRPVPIAHPSDPRAPFARLSPASPSPPRASPRCKGTLRDGRVVAVKIQRPGVYEQVALDMYVVRLLLAGLRAYWKTDTDIPAVADEVGAGLLRELDFRLEAVNASVFARRNGAVTPFLRVPSRRSRTLRSPRG